MDETESMSVSTGGHNCCSLCYKEFDLNTEDYIASFQLRSGAVVFFCIDCLCDLHGYFRGAWMEDIILGKP